MQSFRNLKVWTKAHQLTLDVYKLSRRFPREELFGLTSQARRAAVSIGANIAEGCCRKGDCEMGRFLQIAVGSASELEYHLLVAYDLQLLDDATYKATDAQVIEVKRMLAGLISKLKSGR
jgi:four helix bundle protein